MTKKIASVVIILGICLSAMNVHAGLVLTTLASFNGTNGSFPMTLIQTTDGSLIGTAGYGGIGFNGRSYGGNGVIFKLTMDGTLSTLVMFDGVHSFPAYMLRAADQNFYGTLLGGNGALFKLNPDASLANFDPVAFGGTSGESPVWLVQDHPGNLYGVTQFGGLSGLNFGTVFKIDTNSAFNTVARFYGTNGSSPIRLILGDDGNFYGTTAYGGIGFEGSWYSGNGTVFKMTPDGNPNTLFSFQGTNGSTPWWLIQGSDGNLYGTSNSDVGYGSLFKMTTSGTLLWSFLFNGTNGSSPFSLIQGNDGNFYGVTAYGSIGFNGSWYSGNGTVYRITSDGEFTSLLSFVGTNLVAPNFLITGTDGNFYGTTEHGGQGFGSVIRLSVPMSPVFQKAIRTNDSIALTWSAVAGQTYQLQYNTSLTTTNWNNFGNPIVATNGVMSATDSIGTTPQRLYRVVLLP